MPRFHPNEELLQAYAAGHLEEAIALLVATHTALCPDCRHAVEDMEEIGGALLDGLEPTSLSEDALDRCLQRLGEPEAQLDIPESKVAAPMGAPVEGDILVPEPLRGYLGGALASLDWRTRGNVSEVDLLPQRSSVRTKLLKIRAGAAIPQHTHEGAEITMVLSGGFSDEHGHYLRGDVSVADNQIEHRPVADDDEDCLCISITDAPLRFTGPVGRWLNMFVRF